MEGPPSRKKRKLENTGESPPQNFLTANIRCERIGSKGEGGEEEEKGRLQVQKKGEGRTGKGVSYADSTTNCLPLVGALSPPARIRCEKVPMAAGGGAVRAMWREGKKAKLILGI